MKLKDDEFNAELEALRRLANQIYISQFEVDPKVFQRFSDQLLIMQQLMVHKLIAIAKEHDNPTSQ